jgi:hypothetical protein
MIPKNTWVQIHKILLKPEERSVNLPEDTRKVPFEMWTKGFLEADAEVGDSVVITTVTGRKMTGTLLCANPAYRHDYGVFIPEILEIDRMVKTVLFGEKR